MTTGWKAWVGRLALSASVALSGCMAAADDLAETAPNQSELVATEPTTSPVQASALATPDEFGGYFANGVGAFLSAKNNVAELTLYVLPPAETATFKHPSLLLVMPQDQDPASEANDFEDVTLTTGQSHAFHVETPETLTQVIASFEY